MADYPDPLTRDNSEANLAGNRLDNFLSAVYELKYNISHIEQKYPFLGSELSALCEQTISRLSPSATGTAPDDELEHVFLPLPFQAQDEATPEPVQPQPAPALESSPPSFEIRPAAANGSRVAYSLDAAGGFLVTWLDKMGDGIILAFEKLLSLGQRNSKQPPLVQS